MTSRREQIRRLAREHLGFDELRPGQLEAVESVLDGRDTLCVMATGSGKTAIYELAGLMAQGPTIVVSPLIALQRDQVKTIGHGEAVMLNSALGRGARAEALREAETGEARFILLAPEQLAHGPVLEELAHARPSLFVIDEAHCVSQWGQDFRPDYLKLGAAAEALGRPPVLALTATAALPVRKDIISILGLNDPAELVRGFDRPNIHLAVRRFYDAKHKRRALIDAVGAAEGPGLVYVATRRASEELSGALVASGVSARAYHAGLGARERDDVQDAFMSDRDCRVVAATVAFGMGVDKPNVRWVFHEEPSESLDAYYQEIGRAGRDGEPAQALLFYRPEDLALRQFFAGGRSRGLQPGEAGSEAEHDHHEFLRSRVAMMRAYAERRDCRREFLLGYFGEDFPPPCGNCDNDVPGALPGVAEDRRYRPGDRVTHAAWGAGTVTESEHGQITVVFDSLGYRTLDAEIVAERDLLKPA